ncbi:MAG: hypothetical protein NTY12_02725 [Candidatus Falkowbacteria bacterium]|nr:hypothetical protein [Candidatus Falkowbacteria bacterium]
MASLFREDLPVCTPKNLRQVAEKLELDSGYLALASYPELVEVRNIFNRWYLEIKDFLDKQYIKFIQKDFHSRSWELFCGKLLNTNFGLKTKKSQIGTPDFLIGINSTPAWIESMAPENATNANKILLLRDQFNTANSGTMISGGGPINELADPVVFRIKSKILDKYKSFFTTYLNFGVKKSDFYIIALNIHSFDDGFLDERIFRQIFFGQGNNIVFPGDKKNITNNTKYVENRATATNLEGKNISVGIFLDDRFKYLSGVLITSNDVFNLAIKKDIGSSLFFIHNCNAQNKIPLNIFSFCSQINYHIESGETKTTQPFSISKVERD